MDPELDIMRNTDGKSMPKSARSRGLVRINKLLNSGSVTPIPKNRVGRKKEKRKMKKDYYNLLRKFPSMMWLYHFRIPLPG